MQPDGELIPKQRRWIAAILAARSWDATELARLAGLSPSTLTRFLNHPDYKHALSLRSIAAIEKASGIAAYDSAVALATAADVAPFVAHRAGGDVAAAVTALLDGRRHDVFLSYSLTSHALVAAGYLPGDILVVDPTRRPTAGAVVLVEAVGWADQSARILARIFNPPCLVGASYQPAEYPPLLIDDRTVKLKGVVVTMVRATTG